MADDFSQSLTPPVSPFAADSLCELTPARPPCFCCSETKEDPTGALSTEGYTARGSLKRYSHCQFNRYRRKKQHIFPLGGQQFSLYVFCAREIVPVKTVDSNICELSRVTGSFFFWKYTLLLIFFQRSVFDALGTTNKIPVTFTLMGWQQKSQRQNKT